MTGATVAIYFGCRIVRIPEYQVPEPTSQSYEQLIKLVGELFRMLSSPYLDPDDPCPITASQKRAIVFLRTNAPSTLSELAEALDVNPATASELVERMVEAGLVQRETNPKDRRQIQLSLTEEAIRKAKAMRAERIAEIEQVRAALTDSQWDGFVLGMQAWVTNMANNYPRRYATGGTGRGE